ncbi:unnamed protein product (macronuclear) [Paramecium tetraurelia]|uniref:Trichohyalin-plectin-homology domain-containing protein n=1 Tax=Paramecium tetraurelia TaxID=5888 RepID=A0C6W5_PARTE|nr:uncharacterized protein GSPATT00035661001 [Paramecium tetraurelia]CAK66532.1 unnamed protein product [Paramecium tetraurelia]|eukprot:XP_001433929.1 hypothetical protein (macronuclear) [Paramecium tetraurelia strain d4-2]
MNYQDPTILALKQQNVEQQRQIEQLMGRVNMLIKQQQLLKPPNKKLEIVYKKKKIHDDIVDELKSAKESLYNPGSEQRKKEENLIKRYQLNKAIKTAKAQVDREREEQAKQMKKISSIHQKSIEEQKQQMYQERRTNRNKVQLDEFQSKYNYQLYWDDRVKKFEEEQKKVKHQLSKSMMDQENLMNYLEQQETLLMGRMQQKDAQRLKSKEFEQKYGKPKESKFQQILDIKAKQ